MTPKPHSKPSGSKPSTPAKKPSSPKKASASKPPASARSRSTNRAGLALALCAVLAALMFLSEGARGYRGTQGSQEEIAASRRTLEDLAAREPIDLNAELKRQRKEELRARNGILVDDLQAEQQKILAMTDDDWNPADFLRWFENAAIVGDSIVRQLRLFNILDAPVFAEGGIHISVDLPLLDQVEAAKPSVVFLCFGMNDAGVFKEKIDLYVDRYSHIIRRLQISLPDAVIYVHAALPVSDELMEKEPKYRWLEPYNEAMKQICPELGAYYIDSSFLMDGHPEVFREDGVHPREEYYPMWLTYIADLSGLSHE